MEKPHFISSEEALYFHEEEIKRAGGASQILDQRALDAALNSPKASHWG